MFQPPQGSQPGNSFTNYCWSYDNWGNRWQQMGSNQVITGGGNEATSPCQQQPGSDLSYTWANYLTSNKNQMAATVQAPGGVQYDEAGNVTNDGINKYLYNADGQICAVQWTYNRITVMTGYLYDADGNRVAKGNITSMSCDPAVSGLIATSNYTNYVRDQAGNQLSEFTNGPNGTMALVHTNVYANGTLIATDDTTETHFYLNDWLGTRRFQTNYAGVKEQTCSSLPYGDAETCTPTPTEQLFTGKERDQESGLDNFGARYYSSAMGRFTSPDYGPGPVPYAVMGNPQSLNLYAYIRNNPLGGIDPDGHCGAFFFQPCTDLNYLAVRRAADEQAGLNAYLAQVDQAQQQSSSGGGFWHNLGHGLSNWFHGHSWGYIKTTVTAYTDNSNLKVIGAKNPAVAYGTDAAGVGATLLKVPYVGPASALLNYANDPNAKSAITNGLSLLPGEGATWPTTLFVDGFDYGVNHNDSNVQPWKSQPFTDGSAPGGNYGGSTSGGGASLTQFGCQMTGDC